MWQTAMSATQAILQQLESGVVAAPTAELVADTAIETAGDPRALDEIYKLNDEFVNRYKGKFRLETALSRRSTSSE
jgi:hypothetical protein